MDLLQRFVEEAQITGQELTEEANQARLLDHPTWDARRRRLAELDIEPSHVAAYIERHPVSPPTVKQHLAASRPRAAG